MKTLKFEHVEFETIVEQDDIPVRGNVMASGDDAFDKECEDEILARLDRGEIEAWCHIGVIARWHGFEGRAGLGANSLGSLSEVEQAAEDHGLRAEALEALNAQLRDLQRALAEIE